jgi:hypothetical protein
MIKINEEDAVSRRISLAELQGFLTNFEEIFGRPPADLEEVDNWVHEMVQPENLLALARRLTAFKAANGNPPQTVEEQEDWEATPEGLAGLSYGNN